MLVVRWRPYVAVLAAALVATACTSTPTVAPSPSAAPTPTPTASVDTSKPPFTVEFSWGTFHLKADTAAKVQAHQPINILVEGQADGFPVISKQTRDAITAGLPDAQAIYPMNMTYFAPPGNEYNEPLQISQIEAQLNAGQVDCMSVAPTTSTGLNRLMTQMVDQGIPVFTIGVPTDLSGHDFQNYAQVPLKEGVQAANVLVEWMKANNKDFTVFAVSSALPPEVWAQGRMKSFVATIKQLVPNATFINDETSALDTTLDPATTYDKAKAFLQGNPTVQVLMNTDIGDHIIDKAIVDLALTNKVYTIGWNPGEENLNYIEQGVEVATMDQNIEGMWHLATKACATFFATGDILPNELTLTPVLQNDVAAYREKLKALAGG